MFERKLNSIMKDSIDMEKLEDLITKYSDRLPTPDSALLGEFENIFDYQTLMNTINQLSQIDIKNCDDLRIISVIASDYVNIIGGEDLPKYLVHTYIILQLIIELPGASDRTAIFRRIQCNHE